MELLEQEEVAPPKLRFKASGQYQRYLLGDLCTFSLGRNIKQGEASPEFETPCVRYGELYHMYGEVIVEVVNRTNLDRSELLFSQGNEILLPSAGEDPMDIGNASALTLKGIAIGRTINILRPLRPDAYCHKYVAYYIREKLRETIAALAQGVSISNVYNTQLRTLEVKLPTLPEQQKIAAFLGAADLKIEQLKRKQELLEQYKKGVVQQLFSQELRFKRKDGGEFPEWEEKRLGDVVTFTKGKGVSKGDIVAGGATKCIRYGELYTTYAEVIDKVVSSTDVDPSQLLLSKKNDVIIPASGETQLDIAKASCVMHDGIALGGDLNVMRTKENGVFLAYYLNGAKRNAIAEMAQGNSVVHLYAKQLQGISINLPSLEEQSRIAGFLMALDAKVAGVAQSVAAAQKWKKGLLQGMFV